MARALEEVSRNATSVVGVVGMMHMDGIERSLVQDHGFKLIRPLTQCSVSGEALDKADLARRFEIPIIS